MWDGTLALPTKGADWASAARQAALSEQWNCELSPSIWALALSLSNSKGALLAWETYVYIAKASEINKQKWEEILSLSDKSQRYLP